MTERELQKQNTHKKILQTAGRLFRKKGFAATGVDQIMKAAGLTAGGFYAHFKSKDELLISVLAESLSAANQRLSVGLEHLRGIDKVQAVLARYLSREHRDQPELGCPLPAIASEIHRHGKKSSNAVQMYVRALIKGFAEELSDIPESQREAVALNLVSSAIGGLLLSRICQGSDISDKILMANRKQSTVLLQAHAQGK
jgi:TetR/AcrR family transcriptional repressor of nem operon